MVRRPPPVVSCMECGSEMRTWSRHPLCGTCIKTIREERTKSESLRDFRKKLGKNQSFRKEVK